MPGFEFTPGGMAPLGSAPAASGDSLKEASAARAGLERKFVGQPAVKIQEAPAAPQPKRKAEKPISPREVVRLAKRRRRDIKAELKHHARLENELAQLERLIGAAEGKPLAVVRDMPQRARGEK